MELPDAPTANELAEFVRNNDGSHEELSFKRGWYAGMGAWTDGEIRAVSEAAQRNTSIHSLAIDVANLESNVAAVIARIIGQFHHIRTIDVWDTRWSNPDAPMARPHVVDALLYGIMASKSDIGELGLDGCCSPRTFRAFCERFPNMERLGFDGRRCEVSRNDDADFADFAVSVALCMGKLPSLREFILDSDVGSTAFLRLLSAVGKSPTVDTVEFLVSNGSKSLLTDAHVFCVSGSAKALKSVLVKANTGQELLCISKFFPVGGGDASFSPSIAKIHFTRCEAWNVDPLWSDRAATALTHLETLGLFQCKISPLVLEQFLVKLTRLKNFFCLSRKEAIESTETLDDEFDGTPYVLGTNDALTKFCQVIERPTSLLEEVELDIVSAHEWMHFPAIESLLKHSKGSLIVNFGQLRSLSSFHVAKGTECLNVHLQELRIRFCRCEFWDSDFASFIRALGAKPSLRILEFGFDTHAALGIPESSISALRDLVQNNDSLEVLALRGLCSEAVVTVVERIMPAMTTTNRSLRKLFFFGAGVADAWPRIRDPILAALRMNGVLGDLGGDVAVPEDDHKVQHLLKQNRSGRQFLLPRDSPVPTGLWATIFHRIATDDQHEVMYAFLRAKLASLLQPSLDPPMRNTTGADNPRSRGRKRGRGRKSSRSVG